MHFNTDCTVSADHCSVCENEHLSVDRGVFIESFRQAPRLWSHCKRRTAWPKSADDRNLERREKLMWCYQTSVTWPASTLQLKPESWVITKKKKIGTMTFTADKKINDWYETVWLERLMGLKETLHLYTHLLFLTRPHLHQLKPFATLKTHSSRSADANSLQSKCI